MSGNTIRGFLAKDCLNSGKNREMYRIEGFKKFVGSGRFIPTEMQI